VAADDTNGRELWKSDGTETGTKMVEDINGAGSSYPTELTPIGITQVVGERRRRLQTRPDGDDSGDHEGGYPDSDPDSDDSSTGFELWKSDGTETGTKMVEDINGAGSSYPTELTAIGNTLYFTALDETGFELWKSDDTGTVIIKKFNKKLEHLTDVGNTLYFTVGGQQLWKSDGTETGTNRVKDFGESIPLSLTAVGNTLYFVADHATDYELWKSDGTETGTELVASGSNAPSPLTAVGNTFYFSVVGQELWKSDGTGAGTVIIKKFTIAYLDLLTAVGDTLYFVIRKEEENTGVFKLWKSDGTEDGTVMVKNIGTTEPGPLFAVGNTFYYATYSGELWVINMDVPSGKVICSVNE
jgi:ELWxxDGT repeat protein